MDTQENGVKNMKKISMTSPRIVVYTLISGLFCAVSVQASNWGAVLHYTPWGGQKILSIFNSSAGNANNSYFPNNPEKAARSLVDYTVKPIQVFASQHPYQLWSLTALTAAWFGSVIYWWNKAKKVTTNSTPNGAQTGFHNAASCLEDGSCNYNMPRRNLIQSKDQEYDSISFDSEKEGESSSAQGNVSSRKYDDIILTIPVQAEAKDKEKLLAKEAQEYLESTKQKLKEEKAPKEFSEAKKSEE